MSVLSAGSGIMGSRSFELLALVLVSLVALQSSIPARAQEVPQDFSHAVLPVLKKHCVPCHGGREARGSFSMNTRELLVDSGYVIPGKPEESRILQRILSDDPAEQMPPADQPRLTTAEIAVLRDWIRGEWSGRRASRLRHWRGSHRCVRDVRSCQLPWRAARIQSTGFWMLSGMRQVCLRSRWLPTRFFCEECIWI